MSEKDQSNESTMQSSNLNKDPRIRACDWINQFSEQKMQKQPQDSRQTDLGDSMSLEGLNTGRRRKSLDYSDLSNSLFAELEVDVILGTKNVVKKQKIPQEKAKVKEQDIIKTPGFLETPGESIVP